MGFIRREQMVDKLAPSKHRNILTFQTRPSPPGADPTIASYNASAVKIYNAACSLVRFENKNIFFYREKRLSLLQRWRCSCKFKRVGSRLQLLQGLPKLSDNCRLTNQCYVNFLLSLRERGRQPPPYSCMYSRHCQRTSDIDISDLESRPIFFFKSFKAFQHYRYEKYGYFPSKVVGTLSAV
jgi:hypothetical protein